MSFGHGTGQRKCPRSGHFHDELSACRLLRRYAHDCMNVPAVFGTKRGPSGRKRIGIAVVNDLRVPRPNSSLAQCSGPRVFETVRSEIKVQHDLAAAFVQVHRIESSAFHVIDFQWPGQCLIRTFMKFCTFANRP